jgi:quercetin dioxygenase-like cupin family protein
MKHYAWASVPETPLPAENGDIRRRFVGGAQMTVARITFTAGASLPAHRHVNEQFTLVLEGAMEFTVEGQTLVVRAGECIHLASEEFHGARALEDSVLVDVFSPPRDDWGAPPAPAA